MPDRVGLAALRLRFDVTIVSFHTMYHPLRVFTTLGGITIAGGVALGARFSDFLLQGSGAGSIQSLILAAILILIGLIVCITGPMTDLVGHNFRMSEQTPHCMRLAGLGRELPFSSCPGKASEEKVGDRD